MALMNLYQNKTSTTDINNLFSPVRQSHYFEIGLKSGSLADNTEEKQFDLTRITGIIDTLPGISYQTSWDTSPVSVISENVKSFTDNTAIRTFAQHNKNYRAPIVTDGWTQLMPKEGCALSVSLSFKSYPGEMFSTTDFRSIINFLLFMTTPREYYLSDSVDYINKGLNTAYARGQEFGKLINHAIEDYKKVVADNEEDRVNNSVIKLSNYMLAEPDKKDAYRTNLTENQKVLADELTEVQRWFDTLLNMSDDNVGGVPLCSLKIGHLINEVSSINWLIKSWSFKPCINTTKEYGIELPLFVEFKIDLETQTILSNNEMKALVALH